MGNRSKAKVWVKGKLQGGSFGAKKFVEVHHKNGEASVISLVRPNRGSRKNKHLRLNRKGSRPVRLGDMKLKTRPQFSDSASPAKESVFGRAKKLFQRKAK